MVGNTILLLSPHTDDAELGCGATIAKLIREGKKVYYAAFSACEHGVREFSRALSHRAYVSTKSRKT